MSKTKIEWCDHTINPIVGCSKCSPGCDNCYAERIAARMAKNPNAKICGKYTPVVDVSGKWNGKTAIAFEGWESSDHLHDWMLAELPKKPSRIFVGSMGDIFHESVEQEWLEAIWEVMRISQQHTFMLLTKREKQLYEYAHVLQPRPNPLPNVWLGVTVCNQQEADKKIPILLSSPAAKRFVSIEPMLGAVDLDAISFTHSPGFFGSALRWKHLPHCRRVELQNGNVYPKLDWVIAGPENGPGARPAHPVWFRSLRDQCQEAGVSFFFKGNGGWAEHTPAPGQDLGQDMRSGVVRIVCANRENDGHLRTGDVFMRRVGKKVAGRLLEGREWNEVPS